MAVNVGMKGVPWHFVAQQLATCYLPTHSSATARLPGRRVLVTCHLVPGTRRRTPTFAPPAGWVWGGGSGAVVGVSRLRDMIFNPCSLSVNGVNRLGCTQPNLNPVPPARSVAARGLVTSPALARLVTVGRPPDCTLMGATAVMPSAPF